MSRVWLSHRPTENPASYPQKPRQFARAAEIVRDAGVPPGSGGEKGYSPAATRRLTAALVSGATYEIIPEAGHFPWLEQPDRFRAAVARALRREP